jgi:hypothetical protein
MDPIANIRQQLDIAKRINAVMQSEFAWGKPSSQVVGLVTDASALADLVEALDEWRRDGGFDPYAKQRA